MDLTNWLALLGGLSLFLFGMHQMGDALEKSAGNRLKIILGKLTSNPFKGFLLGVGVTAIIQSSCATTVMVVGFVNSGVMTLAQATGIIMGANLGTAITSWILSLTGIQGDAFLLQLFKPSTFTPIIAFIGIVMILFVKKRKKQDFGMILIGFAVLMFGMQTMSSSVDGLTEIPAFTDLLLAFSNPVVGVLVGIVVTAIIQSSSATVGILQALSMTGAVPFKTAIPLILGMNIGTCITALISSIGATKNAKRAAFVHLYFNVFGTVLLLSAFYAANALYGGFALLDRATTPLGIAIVHTGFKIISVLVLFPFAGLLEKLAVFTVPDGKEDEKTRLLDDLLIATPAVAIDRCKTVAKDMADLSMQALRNSITLLDDYDGKRAEAVMTDEEQVDVYEDKLGSYLVKLCSANMTEQDSNEATKLLHMIGDFERISDHAVNIAESAEEISDKKIIFSLEARHELSVLLDAIREILDLSLDCFIQNDVKIASLVEPLEQVIDDLKDELKRAHIERLSHGECTIELGFVLTDIVTDLERVADHCSNIAGCVIEMSHASMDMHEYLDDIKKGDNGEFVARYQDFKKKYAL